MVFSNSTYIDENNELTGGKILENFDLSATSYKGILLANFVTGHTSLFKREFLNYFLPVPAEGFYDWWLGFIALYHKKINFLDEVLTQYRVHNASVIQRRLASEQTNETQPETTGKMLLAFAGYKNLNNDDQKFIGRLADAYRQNRNRQNSIHLFKIVSKYYDDLFPGLKKRKGLSRLNFAFKYIRKVKS
jgi:hypothetical protein